MRFDIQILLVLIGFLSPNGALKVEDETGRLSAMNPSRLRVHIVPHTHDDSGWLKTVNQYYWGDRQGIQSAGVQYILDSVVQALVSNPERRFTYAEMSFFSMWWKQQDESMRDTVRRLVKEGRLNFVNGGYVQHDEAGSHYVAMIDQTTRGHRFLKSTFGYVPKVGWQIDPFGHSSIQAGLMGAELGFEAVFFGRADHEDMNIRREQKMLEMVWHGVGGKSSCNFEKDTSVFLGNFASGNYGPPPGFNWEFGPWSDTPVQDDPSVEGYNVPSIVDRFLGQCRRLSSVTRGNDIMFTMGSDFHYSNAHAWYKNLDKLIHYLNLDGRVEAFYSSPHDYAKAKHNYSIAWPVKMDDFFPYSDFVDAFWTGYFTSRPTSKRFIREATSLLQIGRHLELYLGEEGGTDILEEAVSLCQHHDSITGTEKQHVANDYHLRLHRGIMAVQQLSARALSRLIAPHQQQIEHGPCHLPKLEFCNLRNISICDVTVKTTMKDSGEFAVVIYNPLAFSRVVPLRIPIKISVESGWQVRDFDGQVLPSQIVPLSEDDRVWNTLERSSERVWADAELVFLARVPSLGYSTFFAERDLSPSHQDLSAKETEQSLSNEFITLEFDPLTGLMTSMTEEGYGTIPLSVSLWWYNSSDGLDTDRNRGQSSGAYIFRPNGKYEVAVNGTVKLEILHGYEVSEARQTFNSWATLVTRLYRSKRHVEVEWTVGPLPEDRLGREVVVLYKSGIKSDDEWWTDLNGRTMIKRKRNHRWSWKSNLADSISGNFYPMTSEAYIEEAGKRMSIITDRAQGVSSLEAGELEIMVHRRTTVDDRRGVGEPLHEITCVGFKCQGLVARGSHIIKLSTRDKDGNKARRKLQLETNDDVLVAFMERSDDHPTWREMRESDCQHHHHQFKYSFLADRNMDIPFHLLTLMKVSEMKAIMRIAHQMDASEGGMNHLVDSANVYLLLQRFGCPPKEITEVSLSTNQKVDELQRLEYMSGTAIGNASCEDIFGSDDAEGVQSTQSDTPFSMHPMQIRTFEITCVI